MAPQLTLIVLTCAIVAVCNAEAPFRGYSSRLQQQQAAPYPASGFRPDRPFNLPSADAIAQQLRLAQIKKLQQEYLQQQQQTQQQQQQVPISQLYGAPSESEASQPQIPQQPSGLYGAPSQEGSPSNLQPSDLTRPQRPSQQYGAPEPSAASQLQSQFLRPQQVTSQRQTQFQRQQQPSRQYGAPISKATPEGNSGESLEENRDVENVAPQAGKPGRLTQGNQERDTENDENEASTNTATAATAIPAGFVLVPVSAAPVGFTPQKLALLPAPATASFAKLQLPTVFGVPQQKLLAAPQLLAQPSYYQPQQFAFAAPLQQAW